MAILLSTTIFSSAATKLSFNHFNTNSRQSSSPAATTSLGLSTRLNVDQNRLSSKKFQFFNLAVKNQTNVETAKRIPGKIKPREGVGNPVLSEGRDDDEKYGPVCPGCGVFMQDQDPDLPGYYQEKKIAKEKLFEDEDEEDNDIEMFIDEDEGGEVEVEEDEEGFMDDSEDEFEESDGEESKLGNDDEFDWDSDEWEDEEEEEKVLGKDDMLEYSGFGRADVGYGNITEETIKKAKRKRVSKSERKRLAWEALKVKDEVTVCARCHSLRNYGQVKNPSAENLIPDFDFDRLISTRLVKPTGSASSTVVVMVVDCVDFDGSFPKRAAKSLFKALEGSIDDPKHPKHKRLPKLVLVATKVDLLPSQVSPTRLDRWVRRRARACGAPKLSGVYLVSSRKDLGVRNLLAFIKELAGPRGNVWIIGAQNAGKSTLINAFSKKSGANTTKLTEAPVPGTTLGILRIVGILSAKAKMYDTPGLLHPYLMSMRLNRDEQKMVEIRKELKPRSYRIKVGQALHVGGLMRLDLNQASVETIYVTVWVSPSVPLHMGKSENADDFWRNHVGVRLQPPIGVDRASKLGKWEARKYKVTGVSWDVNSADIAVAGFGWFSLGLKGEATLTLSTYAGIETTVREPLILDRASSLERAGFLLPKAIADELRNQSILEERKRKKLEEEDEEEEEDLDSLLEAT